MPVWSEEQIERWTLQAEEVFIKECSCLIDRFSLNIESGSSLYTLPDAVKDVRRITYKGVKLYPLTQRTQRDWMSGSDPSGTPTDYIFSNQGLLTIKLWPTPNETITAEQNDLFMPEVIRRNCIVEAYFMADGINYQLPDYIRRRILKPYILKLAYRAEGKGQNLKASKYWDLRWKQMKELYINRLYDMYNKPRKLIQSSLADGRFPRRPSLPPELDNIGVDIGE